MEADYRLSMWKQSRKCNKHILNSLLDVIHKNKRNAVGNSEMVVHSWPKIKHFGPQNFGMATLLGQRQTPNHITFTIGIPSQSGQ